MRRDESLTTAPELDIPKEFLELLTVEDVAALLKVSKSWVYEHTRTRAAPRSDRLPHLRSASTSVSIHTSCAHSTIAT
jgi:predicted DNA-binding transcriptional regulator AlpA